MSSSPIDGEFYFVQTDAVLDSIATAAIETPLATPVDPHGEQRAAAPATAADSAGAAASATTAGPPDQGPSSPLTMLRSLAEQGRADAQTDLGFAYAKGRGVARDDAVALHWFQLAAAQGVAKAQYLDGSHARAGARRSPQLSAALQWYRRAADQGYPPAEVAMGRFYGRGLGVVRDAKRRTDWYRRAADAWQPDRPIHARAFLSGWRRCG